MAYLENPINPYTADAAYLPGLKGMTAQRRAQWEKENEKYLKGKDENFKEGFLRQQQFIKTFGNRADFEQLNSMNQIEKDAFQDQYMKNLEFQKRFSKNENYDKLKALDTDTRNRILEEDDIHKAFVKKYQYTKEYLNPNHEIHQLGARGEKYLLDNHWVPDSQTDVMGDEWVKQKVYDINQGKENTSEENTSKIWSWVKALPQGLGRYVLSTVTELAKGFSDDAKYNKDGSFNKHWIGDIISNTIDAAKKSNTAWNKDIIKKTNKKTYDDAVLEDMKSDIDTMSGDINNTSNYINKAYSQASPEDRNKLDTDINNAFLTTAQGREFYDMPQLKNLPHDKKVQIFSTYLAYANKYGDQKATNWLNKELQRTVSDETDIFSWYDDGSSMFALRPTIKTIDNADGTKTTKILWGGQVGRDVLAQIAGVAGQTVVALRGENIGATQGSVAQGKYLQGFNEDGSEVSMLWNPQYWEGVSTYGTFDWDEIKRIKYGFDSPEYQQFVQQEHAEELKKNPSAKRVLSANSNEMKRKFMQQSWDNGAQFAGSGTSRYKFEDTPEAESDFWTAGTVTGGIGMMGQLGGQWATGKLLAGIYKQLLAAPVSAGWAAAGKAAKGMEDASRLQRAISQWKKISRHTKAENLAGNNFIKIGSSTVAIGESYGTQAFEKTIQQGTEDLNKYLSSPQAQKDFEQYMKKNYYDLQPKGGENQITLLPSQDTKDEMWNSFVEDKRNELIKSAITAHDISAVTEMLRYGMFRTIFQQYLWRPEKAANDAEGWIVRNAEGKMALANTAEHVTKKVASELVLNSGGSNYLDELNTAFSVGYGRQSFNDYLGTRYRTDIGSTDALGKIMAGLYEGLETSTEDSSIKAFTTGLVGGAIGAMGASVLRTSDRPYKTIQYNSKGEAEVIDNPLYQNYTPKRMALEWLGHITGIGVLQTIRQDLRSRDYATNVINDVNKTEEDVYNMFHPTNTGDNDDKDNTNTVNSENTEQTTTNSENQSTASQTTETAQQETQTPQASVVNRNKQSWLDLNQMINILSKREAARYNGDTVGKKNAEHEGLVKVAEAIAKLKAAGVLEESNAATEILNMLNSLAQTGGNEEDAETFLNQKESSTMKKNLQAKYEAETTLSDVKNMLEQQRQQQEQNGEKTEEVTDDEVKQVRQQLINQRMNEDARTRISHNAQKALNLINKYGEVRTKWAMSLADPTNQEDQEFIEDLVFKELTKEDRMERINSIEQTLTGRSKVLSEEDIISPEKTETPTIQRLMADDVLEKSVYSQELHFIERAIESRQKKLDKENAKEKKDADLISQLTAEIDNLNIHKNLLNEKQTRREQYKADQAYDEQVVTADEIINATPDERLFMLSHEGQFSAQQNKEIEIAHSRLYDTYSKENPSLAPTKVKDAYMHDVKDVSRLHHEYTENRLALLYARTNIENTKAAFESQKRALATTNNRRLAHIERVAQIQFFHETLLKDESAIPDLARQLLMGGNTESSVASLINDIADVHPEDVDKMNKVLELFKFFNTMNAAITRAASAEDGTNVNESMRQTLVRQLINNDIYNNVDNSEDAAEVLKEQIRKLNRRSKRLPLKLFTSYETKNGTIKQGAYTGHYRRGIFSYWINKTQERTARKVTYEQLQFLGVDADKLFGDSDKTKPISIFGIQINVDDDTVSIMPENGNLIEGEDAKKILDYIYPNLQSVENLTLSNTVQLLKEIYFKTVGTMKLTEGISVIPTEASLAAKKEEENRRKLEATRQELAKEHLEKQQEQRRIAVKEAKEKAVTSAKSMSGMISSETTTGEEGSETITDYYYDSADGNIEHLQISSDESKMPITETIKMDKFEKDYPDLYANYKAARKSDDDLLPQNVKDYIDDLPVNTQRMLRSLFKNQQRVVGEAASDHYTIREDDGENHIYERLHSVLPKNYDAEGKDNSGNDATDHGTYTDDCIRDYFIYGAFKEDTEEVNMTAEAQLELMDILDKIKENMTKLGLVFVTNNVVLYHKYADGRRIAGSPDILAINKKTGELYFYDIKTKKSSFYNENIGGTKFNTFDWTVRDSAGNIVKTITDKSEADELYKQGAIVKYGTYKTGKNKGKSRAEVNGWDKFRYLYPTKKFYTWQVSGYKNLFDAEYGQFGKDINAKMRLLPLVLGYGSGTTAEEGGKKVHKKAPIDSIILEKGIEIMYDETTPVPREEPIIIESNNSEPSPIAPEGAIPAVGTPIGSSDMNITMEAPINIASDGNAIGEYTDVNIFDEPTPELPNELGETAPMPTQEDVPLVTATANNNLEESKNSSKKDSINLESVPNGEKLTEKQVKEAIPEAVTLDGAKLVKEEDIIFDEENGTVVADISEISKDRVEIPEDNFIEFTPEVQEAEEVDDANTVLAGNANIQFVGNDDDEPMLVGGILRSRADYAKTKLADSIWLRRNGNRKAGLKRVLAIDEFCTANGIDIQKTIDTELGVILKEQPDIKIHFMMADSFKASNKTPYQDDLNKYIVFLAIERSTLTDNYHKNTDGSLGKYFTSENDIDGKKREYMIVGSLGFDLNTPQYDAWQHIINTVKNQRGNFGGQHNGGMFVADNMYTEAIGLNNGFIITQTEKDNHQYNHTLSELVSDPFRNPDINSDVQSLDDLSFGMLTKKGYISFSNVPVVVNSANMKNYGSLYVHGRNSKGEYIPLKLQAVFYDALTSANVNGEQVNIIKEDSRLKKFITAQLRQCLSAKYEDRKSAVIKLSKVLHFSAEDGPNILIGGKDKSPVVTIAFRKNNGIARMETFKIDDTLDVNKFWQTVKEAAFRINMTEAMLGSRHSNPLEGEEGMNGNILDIYDEAGALITTAARLRTAGAMFSVYAVNSEGAPIKTGVHLHASHQNSRLHVATSIILNQTDKYYELSDGTWMLNGEKISANDPNHPEYNNIINIQLYWNKKLASETPLFINKKGNSYYDVDDNGIKKLIKINGTTHNVTIFTDNERNAELKTIKNTQEEEAAKQRAANAAVTISLFDEVPPIPEFLDPSLNTLSTEDIDLGEEQEINSVIGNTIEEEIASMISPSYEKASSIKGIMTMLTVLEYPSDVIKGVSSIVRSLSQSQLLELSTDIRNIIKSADILVQVTRELENNNDTKLKNKKEETSNKIKRQLNQLKNTIDEYIMIPYRNSLAVTDTSSAPIIPPTVAPSVTDIPVEVPPVTSETHVPIVTEVPFIPPIDDSATKNSSTSTQNYIVGDASQGKNVNFATLMTNFGLKIHSDLLFTPSEAEEVNKSGKNGGKVFVRGEISFRDVIRAIFAKKGWAEYKTTSEAIEILKSHGKITENIPDLNTWLEELKNC